MQIHESESMLRRFPIRQNDSKAKSAKKAVAPLFLLLLKRVKAILEEGRFSPIHSWTVCFVAVEYFQEESLRVLTGS